MAATYGTAAWAEEQVQMAEERLEEEERRREKEERENLRKEELEFLKNKMTVVFDMIDQRYPNASDSERLSVLSTLKIDI